MVKIAAVLLLTAISSTQAFPHLARNVDTANLKRSIDTVLQNIDIRQLQDDARDRQLNKRANTWSPSQLVDVTGPYAWAAPTASQTRGPCPALNALANHGYFDRSGNQNLVQSVHALTSVLNMGVDTAIALVAYSIAIIGDPVALTWSIGRSPGASTVLPGLLSPPGGIDQSHNNYESDASIVRGDSYLSNGDVWSVHIDRFKRLYALQSDPATADYNDDVINEHRKWSLQNSIETNPHFFFSPFPGLVVSTAAHKFVPAFFSNHSAEHPDGVLNQANLKSFFGIYGDSIDDLTTRFGYEQIPANWYHRPTPYTLVDVVAGVLNVIQSDPQAGKVGGNTGKVNSFTGVDLGNLSGGVFNAQNLLEGNNLICFAFSAARAGLPSVLGGVASLVGDTLDFLDNTLGGLLPGITCPEVDKWNLSVFNQFPGSN